MTLFVDEATFSSHGRRRLQHAALVLRRKRNALCEWNDRDNNEERQISVEGCALGTNAATDRIDPDATAAKVTTMMKGARANNEGVTEARLLRAFWDWRLMGLGPLRLLFFVQVLHLGCML